MGEGLVFRGYQFCLCPNMGLSPILSRCHKSKALFLSPCAYFNFVSWFLFDLFYLLLWGNHFPKIEGGAFFLSCTFWFVLFFVRWFVLTRKEAILDFGQDDGMGVLPSVFNLLYGWRWEVPSCTRQTLSPICCPDDKEMSSISFYSKLTRSRNRTCSSSG